MQFGCMLYFFNTSVALSGLFLQKLVCCEENIFLSTQTHFHIWITFLDSIILLLPYDEAQSLHTVWFQIAILVTLFMCI